MQTKKEVERKRGIERELHKEIRQDLMFIAGRLHKIVNILLNAVNEGNVKHLEAKAELVK